MVSDIIGGTSLAEQRSNGKFMRDLLTGQMLDSYSGDDEYRSTLLLTQLRRKRQSECMRETPTLPILNYRWVLSILIRYNNNDNNNTNSLQPFAKWTKERICHSRKRGDTDKGQQTRGSKKEVNCFAVPIEWKYYVKRSSDLDFFLFNQYSRMKLL